tara:strand:- start:4745 stop:5602 length:858 start_codon:yes stop_codon:yes gene_type:complete
MKKITIYCYYFVGVSFEIIVSLLSVLLFSSISTVFKLKKQKNNLLIKNNCIILGNGPSLKTVLENDLLNAKNKDIFVVNFFFKSTYFNILKPKYYVLADTAIFKPSIKRHFDFVEEIIENLNKVSWEMYLLIPSSKNKSLTLSRITNKNIKFIFMNTTPVNGSKSISHFLYKNNVGMPRCQNVLNLAIFSAINLGYKNVYLYGADHSWTKDLFVNEQNEVCYGDRHIYKPDLTIIKKENTIHDLLMLFSHMFKSHKQLRNYADSVDCSIYNYTKESFIDAYKRSN